MCASRPPSIRHLWSVADRSASSTAIAWYCAPPDHCVVVTAGGEFAVQADCLRWLAAFDAALEQRGFEVELDLDLRARELRGEGTFPAARTLGYAAVVDVSQLEVERSVAWDEVGLNYAAYRSNIDGARKKEIELPQKSLTVLDRMSRQRISQRNLWQTQPELVRTSARIEVFRPDAYQPPVILEQASTRALGYDAFTFYFLYRGKKTYWRPLVPRKLGDQAALPLNTDDRGGPGSQAREELTVRYAEALARALVDEGMCRL